MPKILFITPGHEDYLADSLLHGLRTELGADVIDYPKVDWLYDSYPAEQQPELYGRGFTLYRTLPDMPVDRGRVIRRAVDGEFDLVVFADIWNTFGWFVRLAPTLPRTAMAVIDGADRQEPFPYGGAFWRVRDWWTLPRAPRRSIFFKRELTPATGWFRSYLMLPPRLAQRLPSLREMHEISFSFPEEKILRGPGPAKDQLLASHVVDPEVAAAVGATTSYAFSDESAYYADLQRSRFGITTKKAGWDCMRHYEQAANGCVPCFRDLGAKPERCAPHGLDASNCVPYSSAAELLATISTISEERYESLRTNALVWARSNSTRSRAVRFLATCGL